MALSYNSCKCWSSNHPTHQAHLQHAIATHAHCLHYRMPESGASSSDSMVGAANDAFDITLKGSWLIAKQQQQQTQDTAALNAQLERLCRPAPLRIFT